MKEERSSAKGLSPLENDLLRAAIRDRLLPQFKSQTALAAQLGITQPVLSRLINGKGGGSFQVVQRAAKLLKEDVMVLLGKRGPAPSGGYEPAVDEEHWPSVRDKALELLIDIPREEALEYLEMARHTPRLSEKAPAISPQGFAALAQLLFDLHLRSDAKLRGP